MAIKWEEVIKKPEYQALNSGEKDEARRQYFAENVAPQISPEEHDEAFSQFNSFAREKERENMSFMEDVFDRAKEVTYAGLAGAGNSVTGKYIKRAVNAFGGETPFLDSYEPVSMTEKIASNVASIGSDAGVFKLGGALATTGKIASKAAPVVDKWNKIDKLTAGAGAFGLHSGLAEVQRKQERGDFKDLNINNVFSLDNAIDPLIATATGYGTGALVSAAGLAAEGLGKAAGKTALKKGLSTEAAAKLESVVKNTTSLPLEGGALLGATAVTTGEKITPEKAAQLAAELLILKSIHANPFSKEALKAEAQRRGVNETQVIKEIKDSPEMLKDPAVAKVVIEEAGKQAEMKKPEQVDLRFKIQDQIAQDMVMRNWKPGKTPEEILQLSQIPKEYRDYALTKTESGTYATDPRILEKVNEHIKIKEIFDDSNLPFKDDDIVNRFQQTRDEYKAAKENLVQFDRARDSIWEDNWKQAIDRHIGDYRRFENQPEVRNRMDEVKDQILSTIEPEQIPNIINDPGWLNSHYDPAQMGMKGLNKNHIKAVEKEVLATLMKQSNMIPQHIIDKATSEADYHTEAQFNKYNKEVQRLFSQGKRLTKDPAFKMEVDRINEENLTPEEKTFRLKGVLDKVRDESTDAKTQILADDTLSSAPPIDELNKEQFDEILKSEILKNNVDNNSYAPGMVKSLTNAAYKFMILSRGYGIAKETASGKEFIDTINKCDVESEFVKGDLTVRLNDCVKDLSPKEKDLLQVYRQRGMETFSERAKNISESDLNRILIANEKLNTIFNESLYKANEIGLTSFDERAANYEIKKKDGYYILVDFYGNKIAMSGEADSLKLLKSKLMIHKIERIQNYLPRKVNPEMLNNKDAYNALVDYLIKTKQIRDDSLPKNTHPEHRAKQMKILAQNLLNTFNQMSVERRSFFQYDRIIDLPETLRFKNNKTGKMETIKAYEQDLDTILSEYAETFGKRITEAKYYGVKDQKLKSFLPKIAAELGQKYHMEKAVIEMNRATELFDILTKSDIKDFEANKVCSFILGYNVVTKMGLSTMSQSAQILQSIPRGNLTSFIKALKWKWQSPEEANDFAIRCGSGLSSIRRNMMKNALNAGKIPQKALELYQFSKMDGVSRGIANATGLFYAEHLVDVLNSRFEARRNFAIRRLQGLDINPEEILNRGRNERGKYELTEKEKMIAARKFEVDTNFRARAIDLPPSFTSSPWMKLLTQFKSASYEQTRNLKNNVAKEAIHGNIQPLVQLLVIVGFGGAVINEIKGLLTGKASSAAALANDEDGAVFNFIIDSLMTVSAFGILNDIPNAIKWGEVPLGPSLSTLSNAAKGVYGTFKDVEFADPSTYDNAKPVYLAESAVREIPVAGAAAQRVVREVKKGDDPIKLWTERYSSRSGADKLKDLQKELNKRTNPERLKEVRKNINDIIKKTKGR